MKHLLTDEQLEEVTGGVANISEESMFIAFTSTREFYNLENCSYEEAKNLVTRLEKENPGLSQAALDDIIKCAFIDHEWIYE